MADAPYQALYRRYRPQRFSEVRGQEHVTRALRNAVRDNKVAHAYLFSGPRGTGKTSTARILAMALNCEAPVEGEPDGTCTSCVAVRQGASMDVFELDAASNRKLDEMRDLLSRVALGTPGRWKVYIIDEVHQLTSDSASALLKTLEEPPAHVVFVLATTDPQKVLPTIQSRAQHFQFHLLDGEVLGQLLSDINEDSGLGLSDKVLRAAVERGRGSARDAESVLEQLAAAGGEVEDGAPVTSVVAALAERQPAKVLEAVAAAVNTGREPRRLGGEIVSHLRDCFLSLQAPNVSLAPESERKRLAEQARQLGLAFTVRAMEVVGQALVDMRDSVDPRVTLEVALLRLASPALDTSPAALVERLEKLEASFGGGTAQNASTKPVGAPSTLPPHLSAPQHPGSSTSGGRPSSARAPGADAAKAQATTAQAAPTPAAPSSTGPAGARAALGAILRAGGPAGPAPQVPLGPVPPLPAGPVPGRTANTSTSKAAQLSPAAAPPARAAGPCDPLPSRDELTKAWGDNILGALDQRARAYVQTGRFSDVSAGSATFALPNSVMVEKAKQFVSEMESALGAHFGRRIPLRLVVDRGAAPVAGPDFATTPEDGTDYDIESLDELSDAATLPPMTAEQRILDAFPGSVIED